ncbi:RagB/SusD family nutrient uptake outer membrane protein [Chitinophaga lutea]
MKTKILLFCLTLFALAGCESLLDVKPQSSITEETYFSNEGDFEPYLTGIYPSMRTLVSNVTYGTERGEELVSALNSRFGTAWNQILSPTTGALNYNDWYKAIGNCNLLLAKIEPFTFPAAPDTRKRIVAETYCLRAWFYFHLARIIGDAPLMLDAVVDENVPLLPRSPVADVFRQVNKDIDTALVIYRSMTGFRPQDIPSRYRFSYASAQSLKADVKMWTAKVLAGGDADLQAAIAAIDEVEKAGLTLQTEFKNVTGMRAGANTEVLLAAYYHRDELSAATMFVNALPYETGVQGALNLDSIPFCRTSGNGQGAYQISPLSRSLFKSASDKRIPFTWITERQASGPKISWITKYPGTRYADDRVADNDFLMYRLADIFLLKAEAYAALGQTTPAVTYLEKVRLRAGTGPYAGATDKLALEREILDERGRELFFENKRWYDLVRFHKGGTLDIYNYIPNLRGKTTPLFWPINTTVMANNDKIKQTEGY